MGNSLLCYLDASKVRTSIGDLDGVNLRDPDDEELGSLKGVLIEAAARRVRYFVVEVAGRSRTHCYLVPADDPVTLQADRNTSASIRTRPICYAPGNSKSTRFALIRTTT